MRILPAIAVLLLSGAPALACSPAPWQGAAAPTARQVGDEALSRQPEFLGKIQIVNVTKDDGDVTKYEATVLKQYIGEPAQQLNAITDETNSCSFIGQAGDKILVALNKNVEENFAIFSLSNYVYGLPEADVEAYLDTWKSSGAVIPAPAPTAAPVTETGESAAPETITPAVAPETPPAASKQPVAEEPAQ